VSTPTAGDHPDPMALADLMAETLPEAEARTLRAHVAGCPHCSGLITDAEGVRPLLLAAEQAAGPARMPADAAARLEARLVREWALADAVPADPLPHPLPHPSDRPARIAPAGGRRPHRPTRGPQRTRRQAREEERDEARPHRTRRWLAIAAGVVLVAGIGGLAIRQAGSPGAGTASSAEAGGTAAPAAPEATTPVLATGTDYTKAALGAQVKALVSRSETAFDAQVRAGQKAPSGQAPGPTAAASPPVNSAQAAAAGNQSLRDPAALQACLQAIDAAGVRPLAVDLARYQGREAAILVLPGRDGGYEVWAVARDCRPGADGTLYFAAIRP